jgi:hypothetical protein
MWQPCSLSSLPGDPAPAAAGRARKQVLYQTRLRPSWEPTSSRSLFLHGAIISSLWMPLAGKKEKNNEQGIGNKEQRNLSSWRFWNRYDPLSRSACIAIFSLVSNPHSAFPVPCSSFPVPYSLFIIPCSLFCSHRGGTGSPHRIPVATRTLPGGKRKSPPLRVGFL